MAASVTERDADGARKGRDKPGRQQVQPNRLSRKRHRSAQDEDEDKDEDTVQQRRKSRRIEERSEPQCPQNPISSSKTSRKSPRLRERQAANQQGIIRAGQTRSSQRPQATQHHCSIENPPPFISQRAEIGRKRLHHAQAEAEAEEFQYKRRARQPRRNTPPHFKQSEGNLQTGFEAEANPNDSAAVSPLEQPQELPPLSEEDLHTLYKEVMDFATKNAPVLKRTSSRRSMAPSEADTVRSQRSSNTNAFYRHKNLKSVQVHIHAEPPDYIKASINRIINAKVSDQRQVELRVIAQELRDGCLKNVRAQSGEDDFIDPLHTALKALGLKNVCLHEKAEWREELKPVVRQQLHFSSSFMAGVQQLEVNDVVSRPRKRQQQAAGEYMSPESLQTDIPNPPPTNNLQESSEMPPPAPPVPEKEGDRSPTKNPRPDLSIGIDLTALISTLSSQNFSKAKATAFIDWLQNEMVHHELDGPLEPMLILVPALRALDLAFPFAVVEGKAYSTGKQIFEAENQAAVSGACALKIQLDLDTLVNSGVTRSSPLPTSSNMYPPLFFSITTQGPIHEIWYHWTTDEDGVRKFESKLLGSCNALILEQGENFLVMLNNMGNWGTGPFVKSIVERLRKVAMKAKT